MFVSFVFTGVKDGLDYFWFLEDFLPEWKDFYKTFF